MKNILSKYFFLGLLLFIPFLTTFAATGCYVRDGSQKLYSFTDGSTSNYCGTNTTVYTLSSEVTKNASCQWTPTFPTGSYNCIVVPGGYCGIIGDYTLECNLDSYLWMLIAGLIYPVQRFYRLRFGFS